MSVNNLSAVFVDVPKRQGQLISLSDYLYELYTYNQSKETLNMTFKDRAVKMPFGETRTVNGIEISLVENKKDVLIILIHCGTDVFTHSTTITEILSLRYLGEYMRDRIVQLKELGGRVQIL